MRLLGYNGILEMEATASEEMFSRAEKKSIRLVWSFMHEDENVLCPFMERKASIARLASVCVVRIGPSREIRDLAVEFQRKAKLSAKDALHMACAHSAKSDFFHERYGNKAQGYRSVK